MWGRRGSKFPGPGRPELPLAEDTGNGRSPGSGGDGAQSRSCGVQALTCHGGDAGPALATTGNSAGEARPPCDLWSPRSGLDRGRRERGAAGEEAPPGRRKGAQRRQRPGGWSRNVPGQPDKARVQNPGAAGPRSLPSLQGGSFLPLPAAGGPGVPGLWPRHPSLCSVFTRLLLCVCLSSSIRTAVIGFRATLIQEDLILRSLTNYWVGPKFVWVSP